MATGHHQCHCHLPPPATTTHQTMCCYYSLQPPPPPPPSEPPFHSISSHLHHQHHYPPPQTHLHAPPQNHHNLHSNHHDYYPPPTITTTQNHQLFQKYRQQEEAQETPPPVNPTVSSLIHRIAALESSLRRRKGSPRSSSLRDAAARTIQTHFRAFLVRRSITLRNLKDLAHIKSSLNSLKSSISGSKIHFDSHLLSRESINLLIKLDSIQGSDPMIRDGKRLISRELIRFMELIDEMSTENHVISVKNVRFCKNGKKSVILQREQKIRASGSRVLGDDDDERKFPQNLNNQSKRKIRVSLVPKGEEEELESLELENPRKPQNRIGGLMKNQPKVKKTVSFSENGNVYRLIKSSHSHVSSDDSDSSNGGEEVVEEIGVSSKETEVGDQDSSEMSENEMDPRKNLGTRMNHSTKNRQSDQEHNKEDDDDDDDDDDFVFSAPLPEKMEYRVDSNNKLIGKQ
ncbi:BAG family molecular chaperone regulator 8, chloroplastic [Cynara cardunculus var. scolymus]|uniref:IQ motif, EF-hand binding site-containing protein n=1 Tax=Cynara cardunculus var. scolymus TaxID=59895 RepID=A0A118K1E9_CYNCS|nr:BAG family molecular chaperone regulator 8, chloroplastic [Cynara cardunculus var. scolymus]KVI02580.1 IQ motif, EF-hand binding site-containing protein [Cynara cardunculus var. scolymus]